MLRLFFRNVTPGLPGMVHSFSAWPPAAPAWPSSCGYAVSQRRLTRGPGASAGAVLALLPGSSATSERPPVSTTERRRPDIEFLVMTLCAANDCINADYLHAVRAHADAIGTCAMQEEKRQRRQEPGRPRRPHAAASRPTVSAGASGVGKSTMLYRISAIEADAGRQPVFGAALLVLTVFRHPHGTRVTSPARGMT
jgi:hypothetical protein